MSRGSISNVLTSNDEGPILPAMDSNTSDDVGAQLATAARELQDAALELEDAKRELADAARELDDLDAQLEVWAREIPNLDPVTEGIVERIQALGKAFDRSLDETLVESDLSRHSFHVLGKLRQVGPPYRRSAGQLATRMRLSSGAMTNRLDRMEEAGLIRRLPDPFDRRGTLVEPTAAGHAVWDRTVGTQAQREAKIASALDVSERAELHRLLRHLMRAFPDIGHGHAPEKPGDD
jgi:DNA-binding MarR family transcriptional regulator